MNLSDLPKLAAQNKPVLLGAGAVVAVGAGLYARQKKASVGGGGAVPAAAGTAAGLALPYSVGGQTYPMSGAGGVYDSSASDLYGAIAPQLEALSNQLNPPVPVPVPAAAQQFSPSYTGQYVQFGKAGIYEVQRDGSLYGLTGNEWAEALKRRNGSFSFQTLAGPAPASAYSTAANLTRKNGAAVKA